MSARAIRALLGWGFLVSGSFVLYCCAIAGGITTDQSLGDLVDLINIGVREGATPALVIILGILGVVGGLGLMVSALLGLALSKLKERKNGTS